MPSQYDKLFKISLITLSLMIWGMILIGGLTRLTGSGLSIVEWKPITGLFPPFTQSEWIIEFGKYQKSPEFQKINFGMTLADFQSIFFLEYIHRLWGRLIGIVLFIPTFLMIFKRQHRELWPLLSLLWIMGLAQGVMGWIMVKSGLINDPHVSPYRLSAHLFLGFIIFGISIWTSLLLYKDNLRIEVPSLYRRVYKHLYNSVLIALFLVLLTALFGAFVAGLKAGLVYNTFPLMGDHLIPYEFLTRSPWWRDLFENPVSVQFVHRLCATSTAFFCIGLWIFQRNFKFPDKLRIAFNGMVLVIVIQFLLGLLTLLFMVPQTLALFHQGVAFILFGSLIYTTFLLKLSSKKTSA